MATVYVSMGAAGHHSNGIMPILRGQVRLETISSSASNAQGTLVAKPGNIAKINCATAIIVQAGATASATSGQYVAANETAWIGLSEGQRINVIDA